MTVRTYDTLWKVDKRLYRIGDIVLDRAPLYSQIAFFFAGMAISAFVLMVFGALNYEYAVIKYAGVPLGFCMFMTTIKFDGKRPDRFFLSIVKFYFSPHLINRYRPVKRPAKYEFSGIIQRIIESNEDAEKRGKNITDKAVKWEKLKEVLRNVLSNASKILSRKPFFRR